MKIRFIIFITVLILLQLESYVLSQTSIDITKSSYLQREKIVNIPMKVSYTSEETSFYPHFSIISFISDDKVEVEIVHEKVGTKEGDKSTTSILNYSKEYQVPFVTTKKKIIILWDKNRVQLKEFWERRETEEPTVVENYDGTQTKVYFAMEYRRGKTGEKLIIKDGAIYEGRLKSPRHFRFYPYEVWLRKDIYREFPMKTLPDNTILIDNAEFYSYKKSEIIVSPRDQYMIIYRDFIHPDNSHDFIKVNNTVTVGDFIMPSDIVIKEYDSEEKPKVFKHYYDFSYQLLEDKDLDNLFKYEFPEGTKIDKLPFLPE